MLKYVSAIRLFMTRLPEHSHCGYCGDPVPFGEEFCSEICREAHAARERKEKLREYAFYIGAAASVAIIAAVGLLF